MATFMTPELNVQVIYSIVYDVYILYSSGSGTRTHTGITAQRIFLLHLLLHKPTWHTPNDVHFHFYSSRCSLDYFTTMREILQDLL